MTTGPVWQCSSRNAILSVPLAWDLVMLAQPNDLGWAPTLVRRAPITLSWVAGFAGSCLGIQRSEFLAAFLDNR